MGGLRSGRGKYRVLYDEVSVSYRDEEELRIVTTRDGLFRDPGVGSFHGIRRGFCIAESSTESSEDTVWIPLAGSASTHIRLGKMV